MLIRYIKQTALTLFGNQPWQFHFVANVGREKIT